MVNDEWMSEEKKKKKKTLQGINMNISDFC